MVNDDYLLSTPFDCDLDFLFSARSCTLIWGTVKADFCGSEFCRFSDKCS